MIGKDQLGNVINYSKLYKLRVFKRGEKDDNIHVNIYPDATHDLWFQEVGVDAGYIIWSGTQDDCELIRDYIYRITRTTDELDLTDKSIINKVLSMEKLTKHKEKLKNEYKRENNGRDNENKEPE